MELFAATVMWDGHGKLTVHDKTQGVQNVQQYLHRVCKVKPEDLRVMSPYTGGAFGSGLRPQYEGVLAVLGARALERSVRLVLTRRQMYGLGHRPASIERLALGDYCVDGAVLIEGKTAAGFAQSLVDGRLFGQAGRMPTSRFLPAYIVEGRLNSNKGT